MRTVTVRTTGEGDGMGWWRRLLRRGGKEAGSRGLPPTALEEAGRQDAHAFPGRLSEATDPDAIRAPHSGAAVAALPATERRALALRLQQDRRALSCHDQEWWAAKALTSVHCGWSAGEVAEMLRLAVTRPPDLAATAWGTGGERALQLPLAALAELPADARRPLLGPVRSALELCAPHHGTGRPLPGRERITARLRDLLGADPEADTLLPPGDPYAVAARCGLGPRLYDPGVVQLLRLCTQDLDVRPDYRWLGTVREHLMRSSTAIRALPALLAAARGLPEDCPDRAAHPGVPGGRSLRLLGALAWAACLSGRHKALIELGLSLQYLSDHSAEEAAFLLRSGLAALGALGGEPGTGVHRRVITGHPVQTVALAAEQLNVVRRFPPGWESKALRHPLGAYTAVFAVHPDGAVTLGFRAAKGRVRPGVPPHVRRRNPVQYAALRAQLTHLRDQVAAHRGTLAERLHGDRGTPAAEWAAEFLDEPALAQLTRALVWQADLPRGPVAGLPVRPRHGTVWVLRDLRGVHHELADTTVVSLWNPRHADAAEVAAWRRELSRRHVIQPVPQLPPPGAG
jgi:hypothetical protein